MHARFSPLWIRCLTALALLAAGTCAFAQSAGFAIQDHTGPHTQPLPTWTLSISGTWPTQCPPTLENLALDDHDLRIDARSVLELCERGVTPFSVELNPALALGRGAFAPGVYRVSFYAADGTQSAPKLRAFALVDRSLPNAPTITPETGFWWSSRTDGSADRTTLSLELQDGQLSAALLSYDDLGQPVWYFGAGPYGGHVAHLPLLRLAGGSAPFVQTSTTPHGDPALALDLEFASSAHASAWLSRTRGSEDSALQLQSLDLVRLPLADSADGRAWQGDWVLVADAADAVPQRLRFDQYRALDAAHFELADTTTNLALTCSRRTGQPDWPPTSCSLHQPGGGSALGNFTSVALARMDGQRGDRAGLHLLRISR
jgi:hypothetical protein